MVECPVCGRQWKAGKKRCMICQSLLPLSADEGPPAVRPESAGDPYPNVLPRERPGPADDEYPAQPPKTAPWTPVDTTGAPRDPDDGSSYPVTPVSPRPTVPQFSLPFEGEVVHKADMYADVVHLHGMNAMAGMPGAAGQSAMRSGCLGASLFIRPLRGVSAGGGGYQPTRPGEAQVQVRHYRVKGDDGVERTCELRGNLRGAPPELGDRVRVEGKVARGEGGLIRASVITNVHSGQSVQAKIPKEIRVAQRRAIAGIIWLVSFIALFLLLIVSCS